MALYAIEGKKGTAFVDEEKSFAGGEVTRIFGGEVSNVFYAVRYVAEKETGWGKLILGGTIVKTQSGKSVSNDGCWYRSSRKYDLIKRFIRGDYF
jgi:hypothetical protein